MMKTEKTNLITEMVNFKLSQWAKEALMSASRVYQSEGLAGFERVQYPTGLIRNRFKIDGKNSPNWEVTDEQLEYLISTGGKIYA
jgi:hypothetical protein